MASFGTIHGGAPLVNTENPLGIVSDSETPAKLRLTSYLRRKRLKPIRPASAMPPPIATGFTQACLPT